MKEVTRIGLVLCGLLVVLVSPFSLWTGNRVSAEGQNEFVTGEVLVKFKEGVAPAEVQNVHRQLGGKVIQTIPGINVQVVAVSRGVGEAVAAYARSARVEYAEPNYISRALGDPNDTYFTYQWGIKNTGQTGGSNDADIDAPEAWDVTTGSSGVKIAILDTGIDQDHEDLDGKIVGNINFTTSGTVDDLYGHGTHVAGIAAAETNNNQGVAGAGYDSSLLNVKVLGDDGYGAYSWIAYGIVWAADNGADVINLSLGGGVKSSMLKGAVNYAWGEGALIVAAAGNSGNPARVYPAYYVNCIAVAATDDNDTKASFSSYGSWVDVAAPGQNIYSTFPNHAFSMQTEYGKSNNYDFGSGTSMSTPHVAGIAALVWAEEPGFTSQEVRNRVEQTADVIAGTGSYWVWGRVNACNAVGGNCSAPVNAPPVVTDIPNQTINEGQSFGSINLDDYVSDPDNSDDEMTWSSNGNVELTVSIVDRVATISAPNVDWNGSETITFRATDPGSFWDEDSATFTVTAVNDPPVVTDIPDQTIIEGQSFATIHLDDHVSDVDNTDAQMAWSYSGNVELAVSIDNRVATITTPTVDWNGFETITFRATDPGSFWDEDDATFTVIAVNDPPVVTNIPDQTIIEGQSFATIHLDDYVSDVDDMDAELTWSYSGNNELAVSIVNRVATIGMPSADWNGTETITFRATDPGSLWDDDPATFTALGNEWAVFLPLAVKQS